jgi:hypothetical protein
MQASTATRRQRGCGVRTGALMACYLSIRREPVPGVADAGGPHLPGSGCVRRRVVDVGVVGAVSRGTHLGQSLGHHVSDVVEVTARQLARRLGVMTGDGIEDLPVLGEVMLAVVVQASDLLLLRERSERSESSESTTSARTMFPAMSASSRWETGAWVTCCPEVSVDFSEHAASEPPQSPNDSNGVPQ